MKTAIEEFRELIKRGLTEEEERRKWEFIKNLNFLEKIVCGAKDKQPNKYGAYPLLNAVTREQTPKVLKIAERIRKEFL